MTDNTHITLEDLRNWGACDYKKRVAYFGEREFVTARAVGSDASLTVSERLWVLLRVLHRKSPGELVAFVQECASRTKAEAATVFDNYAGAARSAQAYADNVRLHADDLDTASISAKVVVSRAAAARADATGSEESRQEALQDSLAELMRRIG